MRQISSLLTACILLFSAGCTTIPKRPQLLGAEIVPNVLRPGDAAIVRATFQDRFGIIDRVEGQIPEDPTIEFKLRDNGIEPDALANDDVWTLAVDVPFNAPEGEFVLTISAYNSEDEPILVQNSYREVEPLKATVTLTIRADD